MSTAAGGPAPSTRVAAPELGDPVLDNPVWASLTGPHAALGRHTARAGLYAPDVSPFAALLDGADPQGWADLAGLLGPGRSAAVARPDLHPPASWTVQEVGLGVQLVDVSVAAVPDSEAVRLTAADVAEMLDLVERTKPGPFAQRTIEMGAYLGIRRGGALVAMAGERMHPAGWTEISAVCTDPAFRGQGLAARLVSAVAAGIKDRGDQAFLHALGTNENAIRLYEAMGFQLRRTTEFYLVTAPAVS